MPKAAFLNLPEDRRQLLLRRATDCFLQKDYAQLTVRDLLSALEISTGSFYNYFADKDDLYMYLMDSIYAKLEAKGFYSEEAIVRVRRQAFSFDISHEEMEILNMFYFLPDETVKKYLLRDDGAVFGNTGLENSFKELQNRGIIRSDLDLDLTIYFYKAIAYIAILYARRTGTQDLEDLRIINRKLYYDLFTNGILK